MSELTIFFHDKQLLMKMPELFLQVGVEEIKRSLSQVFIKGGERG